MRKNDEWRVKLRNLVYMVSHQIEDVELVRAMYLASRAAVADV